MGCKEKSSKRQPWFVTFTLIFNYITLCSNRRFISSMSNSKILTDERAFFGSYNEFLGFISMFSVLTPLPTGPISHFGTRLPLFQNESWCETSHFLARSFLHERLSSSTRFKIKVTACISVIGKPRKIWWNSLKLLSVPQSHHLLPFFTLENWNLSVILTFEGNKIRQKHSCNA